MRSILLASALVLHLVMLVFPFLASVLLAPAGGVAFLLAGWGIGLVVLLVLLRRRSRWGLAVPFAALAFWVATVAVGDAFLDWTA